MAGKTNANIGFEKQLWDAACVLWGHIPAAEYRKVIIGLIFLRYISAAFDKRYQELVEEGDGFEDDRDAYEMDNVFFVPTEARWSNIASKAHTPEIGTIIDNAMRAIEVENKKLKNVLPKNYASPDLDKRILGDVVDIFTNNIDMSDTEASEDLLGRTYEYCIAQFAEKEGVGGGEFYTPASVVKTLVSILRPFDNCRVYDCCCGSGGMFVQSEKFIEAHSHKRGAISVYGQEANPDTWKMAKMNMAIRGIDADLGPYNADTFTNDLHPTLKADFILANPPFNYHPWGQEKLTEDKRWKYGLPPTGNANYAWIQHMIHHLAPNGKIGLVLANGALSTQTSGEGEIRKKIIEDDLIEGIIAMPTQLFYSVTIPVTLWFITKGKKQKGKTLFIDARKMGHMVDRKHRDFTDEDIQKLADTFEAFQKGTLEDVLGFCKVADIQEIEKQDYILTPGRYVGIEEQEEDGEPFEEKMTRLTSELSEMFAKSHELEDQIRKKLGAMKSNWKECSLGDLITFQRGHDLPKSKMNFGCYPVVGSNGVIGYHDKYTTEAPSITIGRSGNVGNPYIVYGKTWSHNTTLYIKDFKGNDPVFIFYLLKIMDLANYAGGSAVPTLNRNHIHTLPICVPSSVKEQNKIGRCLRLFDEKIELNMNINKNLAA